MEHTPSGRHRRPGCTRSALRASAGSEPPTRRLDTNGPERDAALLMGKAALATVLAWQFAVRVLNSPAPFYAPMAALLVVDRTMVRSLGASGQRVLAVVVGMSAAWLVGSVFGVHWWSMLPVLYLALLMARWRRLGDHGIQVPTMVLLSLLTVGGTDAEFTYLTIVETLVGGVIGVLTNAIVLAPLHIHQPRDQIRALTRKVCLLLNDIAAGLRDGWDSDMAHQWYEHQHRDHPAQPGDPAEIETGQESTKLNPGTTCGGSRWTGRAMPRRSRPFGAASRQSLRDRPDARGCRGREREPSPRRPSVSFRELAQVLDEIAGAISHFGLPDDAERDVVATYLRRRTRSSTSWATRSAPPTSRTHRRGRPTARCWSMHSGSSASSRVRIATGGHADGPAAPAQARPPHRRPRLTQRC